LNLGAILNGGVLVRRQLGLGWSSVVVLDEHISDVAFNGETACAFGVIPCKVDADVFLACPVFCDGIVMLENSLEVLGVVFANIFNTKVIDNEEECDGASLVSPQPWGGFGLVVALGVESFSKEVIGKLAGLGGGCRHLS